MHLPTPHMAPWADMCLLLSDTSIGSSVFAGLGGVANTETETMPPTLDGVGPLCE